MSIYGNILKRLSLIGKRIKEERKLLKLTQEELCRQVGISEKSRGNFTDWENGKSLPDLKVMLKLCNIFKCELGYLLCEPEYTCKTRAITDIQKATGLSAEAIDMLAWISKDYPISENLQEIIEKTSKPLHTLSIEEAINYNEYCQDEENKINLNTINLLISNVIGLKIINGIAYYLKTPPNLTVKVEVKPNSTLPVELSSAHIQSALSAMQELRNELQKPEQMNSQQLDK